MALAPLVLMAFFLVVAHAQATCYSSTPGSASFSDSYDGDWDDYGYAPEILRVDVTNDSSCGTNINPVIEDAPSPGSLYEGDSVQTYINTDGNLATGDPYDGADKVVIVLGKGYPNDPDDPPMLGRWTGSEFNFDDLTSLPSVGGGGFSTNLDQLGVPGPTALGISVVSSYEIYGRDYYDFAPEAGEPPFSFPVSFSTTPPPPIPPTPPTPPPPPPTSTPTPTPTPTVGVDTIAPRMKIKSKGAMSVGRKGVVSIRLSCPASEIRCIGKLTLKTRSKYRVSSSVVNTSRKRKRTRKIKVKLGSKSFKIAGGKSATVKVRLSKKNRRLLKKHKKIRVKATIRVRDAAGNSRTTTKNITLKVAKKRRSKKKGKKNKRAVSASAIRAYEAAEEALRAAQRAQSR